MADQFRLLTPNEPPATGYSAPDDAASYDSLDAALAAAKEAAIGNKRKRRTVYVERTGTNEVFSVQFTPGTPYIVEDQVEFGDGSLTVVRDASEQQTNEAVDEETGATTFDVGPLTGERGVVSREEVPAE